VVVYLWIFFPPLTVEENRATDRPPIARIHVFAAPCASIPFAVYHNEANGLITRCLVGAGRNNLKVHRVRRVLKRPENAAGGTATNAQRIQLEAPRRYKRGRRWCNIFTSLHFSTPGLSFLLFLHRRFVFFAASMSGSSFHSLIRSIAGPVHFSLFFRSLQDTTIATTSNFLNSNTQ
jgi:hypothetical protein